MKNELLLLTKNDIPFVEAQVNIHQPTISEISLIGEESFFSGCQFLNFSQNMLSAEDKKGLENKPDFEIFMSIMCNKEAADYKNNALMVLSLLFPTFQIKFTEAEVLLLNKESGSIARINKTNYDAFKKILVSMFGLEDVDGGGDNPVDKKAAKIAEKLQKAKQKKSHGEVKKVAIFSRYISILAVGEAKDLNQLNEYTVFQLKDEFKRFQMKQAFDLYVQEKMAGAKDVKEVDNWMDDIHP